MQEARQNANNRHHSIESLKGCNGNHNNSASPEKSSKNTMEEFDSCDASVFGACAGNHIENMQIKEGESSLWQLIFTVYLPLMLLWLKRGVFAITMLFRTVVLGYLLRLVLGNFSEWIHEKSPSWMDTIFQPVVGPNTLKSETNTWPPPALITLALLTILTLVVHPDGLTWVVLGKIKDGTLSVMKSIAECWQFVITGYGVLPSIAAALTIAGLIFVLFAMLRSTLTPRKARRTSPHGEKKKKKRKGHARHRTGKSKSTPTRNRTQSCDTTAESQTGEVIPSANEENTPDLAPLTPVSSQRHLVASEEESIIAQDVAHATNALSQSTLKGQITETGNPILSKSVDDQQIPGRLRVASVSTIDTTALPDDLSCSSKSVVSVPSVGPSTIKSTETMMVPTLPTIASNEAATEFLNETESSKKGTPSTLLRRNKRTGNSMSKSKAASNATDGPSRWDVLRPTPNQKSQPILQDRPIQKRNGDKPARQRQQVPSQRVNSRKAGRAGKGRGGGHHPPPRNVAPGSSNSQFPAGAPVSPPVLEHYAHGDFALPPPPPGLSPMITDVKREMATANSFPAQKESLPSTASSFHPHAYPVATSSWKVQNTGPTMMPLTHAQKIVSGSGTSTTGSSLVRSSPKASFTQELVHGIGFTGGGQKLNENPFANESQESEAQIEAELQALGGQMAGSILDF